MRTQVAASDLPYSTLAEFYEKKAGKRPEALLIVAPYVDEKAIKIAKEQGVEVYTKV